MKRTTAFLTTTMILLATIVMSHADVKVATFSLKEAIAIAVKETPGEAIEAELEDGIFEIKIKKTNGEIEKVYLDAATGRPLEKAAISLDEATVIAQKEVAGKIIKVEFERSRYEIRIKSDDGVIKKVYIDAKSGKVLKIKKKKTYSKQL
ncbi:MAG: PepSY domain-containing protein [bacterium]|nr:PepSY domain-containing protein [bacterium]